MESITLNEKRIGAFTSSQIYRLMGKQGLTDKQAAELNRLTNRHAMAELGEDKPLTAKMLETMADLQAIHDNPPPTAPQLTYIEEKQIETRLGRAISVEKYGRPMAWGHFMEMYVFTNFTGLGYKITSEQTDTHPTIEGWAGSTDLVQTGVKVADIKCYEPKKFAKYADCLRLQSVEALRENFPQEYWQLVSNACINGVNRAEAIAFIPFKNELNDIREMAANYQGKDAGKYRFIYEAEDVELPYIPQGGYYNNVERFEFEIPSEDITELENRVLQSIELMKGGAQ